MDMTMDQLIDINVSKLENYAVNSDWVLNEKNSNETFNNYSKGDFFTLIPIGEISDSLAFVHLALYNIAMGNNETVEDILEKLSNE